jgi:hypothetical protein
VLSVTTAYLLFETWEAEREKGHRGDKATNVPQMATTPPPPALSTLRTPPTPKHGAGYDSYEPYPIRHSTRLASQRIARDLHTTPPPKSPLMNPRVGSTSTRDSTVINTGTLSPPGSANNSPKKRPSRRPRDTLNPAPDTLATKEAEEHKPPSRHAALQRRR